MTEVLAPQLELPIVYFEHPERLGDIALVGMTHSVPSVTLYDDVRAFVDGREKLGSQVHIEGVHAATHAELGRVDKPTRRRYKHIRQALIMTNESSDLLALTVQRTGINACDEPDTWQNIDISILDIACQMPGEYVDAMFHEALNHRSYIRQMSPSQRKLFRYMLFSDSHSLPDYAYAALPSPPRSAYLQGVVAKYKTLHLSIIRDQREQIALNGVQQGLSADPNASFTLLWGKAHIPGLSRGLETMGYIRKPDL